MKRYKSYVYVCVVILFLVIVIIIAKGGFKENPAISRFKEDVEARIVQSDGTISFIVPRNMRCTMEEDDEGRSIFALTGTEEEIDAKLMSDYNTDATRRNFDECWDSWKPERLDSVSYKVVRDKVFDRGGKKVFLKTLNINADGPLFWDYALVFDSKTGKACMVSTYYIEENASPTIEIMDSVRF